MGAVVRVATAANEPYLPYLAAMVRSMAVTRGPGTELELTILYTGISEADRARIGSVADGLSVRWMPMGPDDYRRLGVEPEPLILDPHYFRCLLPRVYAADVDRAVYIDADTIIRRDVTPLHDWPLDGHPVAAAQDLVAVIGDAIDHWREAGLDGAAPYFNSGVLVVDLARWRAEGIGDQVMRECQRNRHRLLIRDTWNQHDQYGFNVVLQHRWTRLPPGWNHYSERPSDDGVGIVHFLGDMKPGAPLARPENTALFVAAIDATPWAGWRPIVPAPPDSAGPETTEPREGADHAPS